jgi:thiaminase (transcriptional activator TenA)
MRVTDKLRKDADNIWKHLFEHPFVTELYSGTLPQDKFKFYILHDYQYLTAALKNFSILAAKAPTLDDMRDVIDILHIEAKSEYEGYEKLLHRLGYSIKDAAAQDPIPISISYGSFLLSTSIIKSYAEAATAVLPCFWSYAEIAEYHSDKLHNNKNQFYIDWAIGYKTDFYQELVEKIKQLVNRASKNCPYDKLLDVFTTASRYEYLFWDAVYNRQHWPI